MKEAVIFEAMEPRKEYLDAINRLLPQLSATAAPMDLDCLQRLTADGNVHLLLATIDNNIAGMCTLATYMAPTGRKAWIEDVVVDSEFRGMRLGRQLIERAIAEARKNTPCTLMLTSRPSRVAANALYKVTGFDSKETNVYKMTFR